MRRGSRRRVSSSMASRTPSLQPWGPQRPKAQLLLLTHPGGNGPPRTTVRCLPRFESQSCQVGKQGSYQHLAQKVPENPGHEQAPGGDPAHGQLTSRLVPGLTVLGVLAGWKQRLGGGCPAQREAVGGCWDGRTALQK